MNNLLYAIAIILLICWALGLFVFHVGSVIYVLLIIAVIAIIARIIFGRKSM